METSRKNIWIILSLGLLMMFISSIAFAQQPQQQQVREDFTEKELQSFVKANEKVMEIQLESQQKMIKAIEDEGMTVEKFNQMAESQQDPNQDFEATKDELQSFNNAAQQIMQERQNIETKVISSIEDEGIDVHTYQEILIAYQQSPKVQTRVNALLKDNGK